VNLLTGKAQRDGEFVSWDAATMPTRYHRYLRHIPVDVEPTAYALLAIITVEPENPLVDGAARWLASNRIGPAWRSTRDTAAAIEALAAHLRLRGVERVQGDVQVFLNDGAEPVGTARFGGRGAQAVDAPVTIDVPASALVAGENRLILRRKGAGEVRWSALLACVVKPEGDGPIKADPRLFRVERDYIEWVRPPLPGEQPFQRIVPGWSIVEVKERPAGWNGRKLRRVGTGDKVRVHLEIAPYQSVERVILEDPLPAGFEVVGGSAEGGFDREERRDDRQVFFFSRVTGATRVSYVLQAIHPGNYRALPASAHSTMCAAVSCCKSSSRASNRSIANSGACPPTAPSGRSWKTRCACSAPNSRASRTCTACACPRRWPSIWPANCAMTDAAKKPRRWRKKRKRRWSARTSCSAARTCRK
jgi:hypothetical protein